MASVKREQILQEAEKLAARGKLDAAIKEYRRALDQAPNDTNTLNRLGDLLVRVNRIDEAIEVYQQIAEHFSQDGFFLKAIAIFKKVNRLDPQRTDTYERLADLYFKQGLVVEGRQQLQTLADWYLRSRNIEQAVRIFRRFTELEPSNFQARARLVDLLVQAGNAQAATTEIDALGRFLLGRNMIDEAIKLYHRAIELSPENGDFVAPCVEAMLVAGRTQPAMELAKKAVAATKVGLELRRAAARACAEAGDLDAARAFLDELMPEVGERTDIVQLYGDVMLRVGEAEQAKDLLLPAVDRLLRAGEVARAAALVKRLLRSAPADIEVLVRAERVFERLNDHDMVVTIELALAEAYLREGRKGEAIDLQKRLVRHHPTDPAVFKRLGELTEVLGLSPAKPPVAVPAARSVPPPTASAAAPAASVAAGEDEISVEFIDVDMEAEPIPDTRGAERASSDLWATREPTPAPAEPPPPEFGGFDAPALSPADELFTEAQVFAKYGLVDKAISHLQRLLMHFPDHVAAWDLLDSLGGDAGGEAAALGVAPPPVGAVELDSQSMAEVVVVGDAPIDVEPTWEPAPASQEELFTPVREDGSVGKTSVPAVEPAVEPETPPLFLLGAPDLIAGASGAPLTPSAAGVGVTEDPTRAHKPQVAPAMSLDDLVAARWPAGGASRKTTAPPLKLQQLEAMLGLSSAPSATSGRAKRAPRPDDVQLDLGALGLPATPARAPASSSIAPVEIPLEWRQEEGGAVATTDLSPSAIAPDLAPPPRPGAESATPAGESPEAAETSPPAVARAHAEDEPPSPVAETGWPQAEEIEVLEAPVDLVEVEEILAGPTPEQLGELDFFIQQGLLDEAAMLLLKLREAFPDHSEVKARHALLKSRGWDEEKPASRTDATASELFSEEEQFFDLAAELEKELAEDELVAEATGIGKGGEVSIEELFREFQRGVAEQIQEKDYDTHFNLGLAYREMGLLDEAIGEFQLALRSPALFIEGASMIGACYLEKGLPEEAAEWYARGLTAPGIPPETVLGLRYELGRAQEVAGRTAEALGNFTAVLAVNPGFRDVVDRVSRLRLN